MEKRKKLYGIICMIIIVGITWVAAGKLINGKEISSDKDPSNSEVVLGEPRNTDDAKKYDSANKDKEDKDDEEKDKENKEDKDDEKVDGKEEANKNIGETIKISSIGNIIIHSPQLPAAYSGSGYDFSPSFEYIKERVEGSDIAVAVLETALKGDGNYSGYPLFNTPDEIIDDLSEIGVNHINFATNHVLDGGTQGVQRSEQVAEEKGLDVSGIRGSKKEDKYTIKEVKGEKIGIISYVYETVEIDGVPYINGIPVPEEERGLINTFNYNKLDVFYSDLGKNMNEMKAKGAEFIIVNLHWGDEYNNDPNWYQTTMAEKLNEMGVDILLGNHPHVMQPYEILTNSEGKKTFVTYGQGNNLSNQCLATLGDARTEDGFIVNFELEVTDKGLEIKEYTIIPVWMYKEPKSDGYYTHRIIPLDGEGTTDIPIPAASGESSAAASLQRTKGVLGENTIGTFKF